MYKCDILIYFTARHTRDWGDHIAGQNRHMLNPNSIRFLKPDNMELNSILTACTTWFESWLDHFQGTRFNYAPIKIVEEYNSAVAPTTT